MGKLFTILCYLNVTFLVSCMTTSPPTAPYMSGHALLEKTTEQEQTSRKMLLKASLMRKQIKGLHREKRKQASETQKKATVLKISELTKSMAKLRKDGAHLRDVSRRTKNAALEQFKIGMTNLWRLWLKNTGPLALSAGKPNYQRSHNPKIASADPRVMARNIPRKQSVSGNNPQNYRSLLASIPAEQNAPSDLNISSFQISRNRQMVGHIEVAPSANPELMVPFNKVHDWRFIVSDTQGNPVDKDFEILGHMPGHVHGLPTQPKVGQKLAAGVYLLEGLKFQMRGWWVIELKSETDRIRFNVVL